MPPAEVAYTTTRRKSLRLCAVSVIAGLLKPASAEPVARRDAKLLSLCHHFDAVALALRHHDDATAELEDDDLLPLLDGFADTIAQIIAMPASTGGGIRAKAGALYHALMQRVAVDVDESFEDQAEDYERLAMSLTRDLTAVPAAMGWPALTASAAPVCEILTLCAAFDDLQRRKAGLFQTIPDDREREPRIEAIEDEQEPLLYRLADLRATTAGQHAARAQTLSFYLGVDQLREDAESDLWPNRLTAAILRDLSMAAATAAQPERPGPSAPDPDSELLRQCATAVRLEYLSGADDQEAADRATRAWFVVADAIAARPARTAGGMRAKAAIIRRLMEPMQSRWAEGDTFDRTWHDPLVWSLVNDLAAVPA
jgi:hypothetical protein